MSRPPLRYCRCLRIEDVGGAQLEITELNNPQTGFLENIGLEPSNASIATTIKVREDITVAPELIANGSPIFNDNTGKYELNQAANDIANAMAQVFKDSQTFEQSGTIGKTQSTLANYASTRIYFAQRSSAQRGGY